MVIWLRSGDAAAGRIGVDDDILGPEMFGHAVALDEAYVQLEHDRHQVLLLAEEQAAAILTEARRTAAELQEHAQHRYDEAEQRGLAAGREAALHEWHRRNLDAMSDARAVQIRMRERLAELITATVEQIVLVERPQALFERALATFDKISDGATYLRISVNPDDYEDAARTFAQLQDAGPRRLAVEVVPDKRLARAACICESDYGVVDASLNMQIEALRAAVNRALKQTLGEERDGKSGGVQSDIRRLDDVRERLVDTQDDETLDDLQPRSEYEDDGGYDEDRDSGRPDWGFDDNLDEGDDEDDEDDYGVEDDDLGADDDDNDNDDDYRGENDFDESDFDYGADVEEEDNETARREAAR